jgi:hypothetical protein
MWKLRGTSWPSDAATTNNIKLSSPLQYCYSQELLPFFGQDDQTLPQSLRFIIAVVCWRGSAVPSLQLHSRQPLTSSASPARRKTRGLHGLQLFAGDAHPSTTRRPPSIPDSVLHNRLLWYGAKGAQWQANS